MFDLNIPTRCLLGPGPSNVHPRILQALAYPLVGHLDPFFLKLMEEVQEMLRQVFKTENQLTIPISGTGSAGMEAAICNFIEPGDPIVICVNGYFGERLVNMAERYGADVTRLDRPWGEAFDFEEIEDALENKPTKLVAIVHAETSTGVKQPLIGLSDIIHNHGALLLVDAVTSLGGVELKVDEWGIDIVYSGTQKCLGVPPGLSPITVGKTAIEVLNTRKTRVANWYLDLSMVGKYWGKERTYHHTAPISMNYALHEGLRIVLEEGMANRWRRHLENASMLWEGLEQIGIIPIVPIDYRLPSLTTVQIPAGIDDQGIRRRLLNEYNIEIAGGLGKFAGKAWRIGLMGHSSKKENVTLLLGALKDLVC
jgi:alanine-glyoxylate transaminase / serine-glyoxylate transaminase / serine-pyruvate transaminase